MKHKPATFRGGEEETLNIPIVIRVARLENIETGKINLSLADYTDYYEVKEGVGYGGISRLLLSLIHI